MRILFVLKRHLISGGYTGPGISSGLYNSAKLVSDMLHDELGHTTKLVVVQDNNDIDREVSLFRPEIVIIEALWVIPNKFEILHRLHPNVKWLVRNHSATPFLSQEGMAMNWLLKYPRYTNVFISCNDPRTQGELQALEGTQPGPTKEVFYAPNYYPPKLYPRTPGLSSQNLNIGCFGAIRPLKNQLIQAVAAIEYAESTSEYLAFHINASRVEGNGLPILHNLQKLFRRVPRHRLVEHPWLTTENFTKLLRRMDLSMQCSYSETFNIISASAVMNDVPVVVSPEIYWASKWFKADPNDSLDIMQKMGNAIEFPKLYPGRRPSVKNLRRAGRAAIRSWAELIETLRPIGRC